MIKEQILFGIALIIMLFVFSWFAMEIMPPSEDLHIIQLPAEFK